MINFAKIDTEYLHEVMELAQKNVEKSDLANLSLFTINPLEKAKIFVFCHIFLNTLYKLVEDTNEKDEDSFKKQLKKEIDLTRNKYLVLYNCLMRMNLMHYNNHKYVNVINSEILKDNLVDDLRDSFAVLLERTNIMSIAKTQGIVLEGKSKDEFNKLFRGKTPELTQEELEEQVDFENDGEESEEDKNEEQDIELEVVDANYEEELESLSE